MRILPKWYHLQHDIAHVLMAVTAHSEWSERLHDWVGVRWDAALAKVDTRNALVLRGEGAPVAAAALALQGLGYGVVSQMHDVVVLSAPPASRVGSAEPPQAFMVQGVADVLLRELRAYLDALIITGENIGDIRRSLFMPWDSEWNGRVRDETAVREGKGVGPTTLREPPSPVSRMTYGSTQEEP